MEEEEGGEENFVGEDDEVGEEDGVEDGEKDDEDEGTDEDSTQQVNAEVHALRQWFPHVSKIIVQSPMCPRSLSRVPCVQDHCPESHVSKIIVQSDNATNLTGKQLSCS